MTENEENGSKNVSPDVMKVSDFGCDPRQHLQFLTSLVSFKALRQRCLRQQYRSFDIFKRTIENDAEGRRYEGRQDHTPPGFNCCVGKNQVDGYVDSSYMSEEQTLCRFGVNFYVNGMSVYEMSRRLPGHYLSSTEAEYYACSIGTCEGKFLVMTLTAMGESQNGPLLIGQDNKSCIQIAENPGRHHGRTKHIELRIRWIEDEIRRRNLR